MELASLKRGHDGSGGSTLQPRELTGRQRLYSKSPRSLPPASEQERGALQKFSRYNGSSLNGNAIRAASTVRPARSDRVEQTRRSSEWPQSLSASDNDKINLTLKKSWLQRLVDLLHESEKLRVYRNSLETLTSKSMGPNVETTNQSLQPAYLFEHNASREDDALSIRSESVLTERINQISLQLRKLLEEESMFGKDHKATSVVKSLVPNDDPRGFYNSYDSIRDRQSSLYQSHRRSLISNTHSDAAQPAGSDIGSLVPVSKAPQSPPLIDMSSGMRNISHCDLDVEQDCSRLGSWIDYDCDFSALRTTTDQIFEHNSLNDAQTCINEMWLSASSWTTGTATMGANHMDHLYVNLWLLTILVALRTQRLLMGYILRKGMKKVGIFIKEKSGQDWARLIEKYWFLSRKRLSATGADTSLGAAAETLAVDSFINAQSMVAADQTLEPVKIDKAVGQPSFTQNQPARDIPGSATQQQNDLRIQSRTDAVEDSSDPNDIVIRKKEAAKSATRTNSPKDKIESIHSLEEDLPQKTVRQSARVPGERRPVSHKSLDRSPAKTSEIPDIGDAFLIDGQWYARVSKDSAKRITSREAFQIRSTQNKEEAPRIHTASRHSLPENMVRVETSRERATNPTDPASNGGRHKPKARSENTRKEDSTALTERQPSRHLNQGSEVSRSAIRPVRESDKSALLPDFETQGSKTVEIDTLTHHEEADYMAKASSHVTALTTATGQRTKLGPSGKKDFTCLQGTIVYFVLIPEHDFAERADFLIENPELLRFNLTLLYREAANQMRMGDYELARQCISCLVIIRLCENLKSRPERIGTRIRALLDSRTERSKEYREKFAAVEEDIIGSLEKQRSRDASVKRSPKQVSSRIVNRDNKEDDRLTEQSQLTSEKQKATRFDPNKNEEFPSLQEVEDDISENISQLIGKAPDPISIAPTDFDSREIRMLSSDFVVRDHASTFFIPGRVFAILWHEPAGQPSKTSNELTEPPDGYLKSTLNRATAIGSAGQQIYSHIKRFVVIRSRSTYCWCISLGSYAGRGLKRKGLKRTDIDAHAIIYDDNLGPQYLPGEPETSKRPIAVKLKPGQTLSKASRLHYGKPSTVEFNIPVQNVGIIRKNHIVILLNDVRNELLGG